MQQNSKIPSRFDIRYEELKEFVAKNGRFPEHEGDSKLFTWVSQKRLQHRYHKLDPMYIKKLNAIGFPWETGDTHWNEFYDDIVWYMNQDHGLTLWEIDPVLADWLEKQISQAGRQLLNSHQLQKITALQARLNGIKNIEGIDFMKKL